MDFFRSYNENVLKPNLKMAVQRLAILQGKKIAQIKNQKREIAKLLEENHIERAMIRVSPILLMST